MRLRLTMQWLSAGTRLPASVSGAGTAAVEQDSALLLGPTQRPPCGLPGAVGRIIAEAPTAGRIDGPPRAPSPWRTKRSSVQGFGKRSSIDLVTGRKKGTRTPEELRSKLAEASDGTSPRSLRDDLARVEGTLMETRYSFGPEADLSRFDLGGLMSLSRFFHRFVADLEPTERIEWEWACWSAGFATPLGYLLGARLCESRFSTA